MLSSKGLVDAMNSSLPKWKKVANYQRLRWGEVGEEKGRLVHYSQLKMMQMIGLQICKRSIFVEFACIAMSLVSIFEPLYAIYTNSIGKFRPKYSGSTCQFTNEMKENPQNNRETESKEFSHTIPFLLIFHPSKPWRKSDLKMSAMWMRTCKNHRPDLRSSTGSPWYKLKSIWLHSWLNLRCEKCHLNHGWF